ncbi:MAG TPA: hypothetical protein VGA67_02690 [Candidatus Dojkabacteria bacterium]|jgi:hypothetical protein
MMNYIFSPKQTAEKQQELFKYLIKNSLVSNITGNIYSEIIEHPMDIHHIKKISNFLYRSSIPGYLIRIEIPFEKNILEIWLSIAHAIMGQTFLYKISFIYEIPHHTGEFLLEKNKQDIVLTHSNDFVQQKIEKDRKISRLLNNYFITNEKIAGKRFVLEPQLTSVNSSHQSFLMISNLPELKSSRLHNLHEINTIKIIDRILKFL